MITLPGIPRISQSNWDSKQFADLYHIWQDLNRVINFNAASGAVLIGTTAEMATTDPAGLSEGTLFWQTDRTVMYMVRDTGSGNVWTYILGTYRALLSSLPTLGTSDTNFLFSATDYAHTLHWNGTSWIWASEVGEMGSGYYQMFEAAPNTLGPNAWQLCDGSTVDRLNADGTVTSVTVPDLSTAAYLKGGVASAAVAAASGATAATTATNNAASTGVTTNNESSHTHAITNPTGGPSSTVNVVADPAGVAVADDVHAHTVTSPTQNGSAHNHGVSDPTHNHTQNSHTHAGGNLELRNKQVRMYYRR